MQKALAVVFLLSFPVCVLAQGKKQFAFARTDKANAESGLKVDVNKKPAAFVGDEKSAAIDNTIKPHSGNGTQAQGPGRFLMNSYYDYGSNGGVLSNIVDYGDGTLAVARMGSTQPNSPDRGTYWAYFNGQSWSPMTRVETALRGWSNLAALADGRSVTASHAANEVNVDTLKGAGVWRSTITGFATLTQAVWPRLTVDGRNNLFICSTFNGTEAGIAFRKEVAISRDRGLTWSHRILLPDSTTGLPQFSADDQAIDSFGDKVAIAAAERGGDLHLWQSHDNGRNWSYRNLTNYSSDIPVGNAEIRVWDTCDLIYDNAGNLHIFWEAVRATQDIPGTPIELFYDRNVGIQHWSEANGIAQAVSWADLPGAALESDSTLFAAGSPFQQINADATLTMQPQAGIDAAGNLYMLFAAYRPLDYDSDLTHFTDIYAVGSFDGGATWGPPVNVTDTPKSEDLWASLADNIGDSLRFVYQSDDNTGNSIQRGGAAPTTFLYYTFDKTNIRFPRSPVTIALPDSLAGSPGHIVNIPVTLALDGNSIAALGANIKATNKILSFTGFTRGPIIPGERFNVNAPAPDSVLLAFTDFGGGPIQQDGVLATLQFQISPQAETGAIAQLDFSEVSASDPQFMNLPVRTGAGQVTVVLQPVTVSIADTLIGAPGDTITVPVMLAGAEHPIEAFGAALKANNGLLAFVGFVQGPIIPGATLNVNAPAPDSVRLAYINFGGGPIVNDGVFVALKFRIKTGVPAGAVSMLAFSDLSASDSNLRVLPVRGLPGKVTVVIQPAEIHGMKWHDFNSDGKKDPNEPGLKDWKINLTGDATLSTTTDSLGNYRFTQLAPGNYSVSELLQTEWQQSFPPQPGTHQIVLSPGQSVGNLDFGNWKTGEIRGLIWRDLNVNESKEANEPVIKRWRVNLAGAANLSATTDTLGNYAFTSLVPGTYKITVESRDKWRVTFPRDSSYTVALVSAQVAGNIDFALEPPVAVEEKNGLRVPANFELFQNYPNPFNPTTTVKYGVPRPSRVKIELYNALGISVAVLVDEFHQPGYYTVKLERTGLPSGMYFYKLTAPGWVETKKMLLMK